MRRRFRGGVAGKARGMTDERDPEQAIERDADELEERIDRLEDHISEAEAKLSDRRDDAGASEGDDVAGDWEDTKPESTTGDDPSGAVD
jgi:uncharacterized protein YhaN